jgi:urease beta subunit
VIPGEFFLSDEAVELAPGHERRRLSVLNGGDRPIQVGSHFHFADSNAALEFDRGAAKGFRLDIPAGTSVRFEPGIERDVGLVALGGERIVAGLQIRSGGRP